MAKKRRDQNTETENGKPKRDFVALGITDQSSLDRFLKRWGSKLHIVPEMREALVRHATENGLTFTS